MGVVGSEASGVLYGLAERLDAERFARVHRSAIVNNELIRENQPYFGGRSVPVPGAARRFR
jgi:DNA-binding LytR/AlgR family response regulator